MSTVVSLKQASAMLFSLGALLALPACTRSSPGGQAAASGTQATPAAVQKTQPAAPDPAPAPAASPESMPDAPPDFATMIAQSPPAPDTGMTKEKVKLLSDPHAGEAQSETGVPAVFNVVAEPAEVHLGEWGTHSQAVGTIKLVNTSETTATITDCKTNCGCTTTNCPKGKTLAPGESADVEVKVNTGAAGHAISKVVTFMVDGQQPLRVTVRADVKEYVGIDPTRLDRTQRPDGRITLTARDEQPFKILSATPAVVDGISPDSKVTHEVFLNWTAFDELGQVPRPQITFALDHPKVDKIQTVVMVNRKADTMKQLADKGIENLPLESPPAEQQLAVAIRYGDLEAIKKALQDVPDQGTRDRMLAVAARQGSVEAVGALLDAGANIESTDARGRTPLMCAVQADKADVLKALVSRGANVNIADGSDVTALARAAGPFGNAAMVKILVEAGANVNAVDKRGQTPLIWAARFGDAAKVSTLLSAGADASAKDKDGKTALDYARDRADEAGAAIAASLGKATPTAGG